MYPKDEPAVLFHSLHHAFKRQVAAEQKAHGVEDLGAPLILLTLYDTGQKGQTLSQRELARRLFLSPATVAVSLRTMERSGYVARRVDESDQRRNLVSITDAGKQAMELCAQAFLAADARLLSGFSAGEKQQLTGFFIRMLRNLGVTNLEKERPPFPPPCELRHRGESNEHKEREC